MMWPIKVAAASGRPDPVGHVRWRRGLVTERGSASGKAARVAAELYASGCPAPGLAVAPRTDILCFRAGW